MTTPHTIPQGSLVVAYDGSEHADRALRWAAVQASLEKRALDVVHVAGISEIPGAPWAGAGMVSALLVDDLRETARSAVEAAAARVVSRRLDLTTRVHVLDGDPRQVLIDLSQHAHLLVLGSRGRGVVRSLLLGSVSAAVSKHAACPVVVARPTDVDPVGAGVVVGADGSAESVPVIEFAFRQASVRTLPLTVVHCYWDAAVAYGTINPSAGAAGDTEDLRALLAESVAGLSEKFPDVHVSQRLEHGLVDHVLTSGRGWDLIVVGRHPRDLWSRTFVGSMATAVLERAHATVAVVPEASTDERPGASR